MLKELVSSISFRSCRLLLQTLLLQSFLICLCSSVSKVPLPIQHWQKQASSMSRKAGQEQILKSNQGDGSPPLDFMSQKSQQPRLHDNNVPGFVYCILITLPLKSARGCRCTEMCLWNLCLSFLLQNVNKYFFFLEKNLFFCSCVQMQ